MNRLSTEKRAQIIGALVEGNSVTATVRMTGAAKNTVSKLLMDIGEACFEYQDDEMQKLHCQRVQCDEIWAFVGAKQKNVRDRHPDDYGDVWTWVAIDADTNVVPCWWVGGRTSSDAVYFMRDLASRLDHKVQLTTDGWRPYLIAVDDAFGHDIDYAQLVKLYGHDPARPESRYSPGECIGAGREVVKG